MGRGRDPGGLGRLLRGDARHRRGADGPHHPRESRALSAARRAGQSGLSENSSLSFARGGGPLAEEPMVEGSTGFGGKLLAPHTLTPLAFGESPSPSRGGI